MKVRVKEVRKGFFGFYGSIRRYPGDVFSIKSESDFSKIWMEKVEEIKPKVEPKPKAKLSLKSKTEAKEGGE